MTTVLDAAGVGKTYLPPPRWLRPMIRVAARQPVPALQPLDLQVRAGEVVGLVGPNGAGKTTLLKILSGLLEPSTGTVRINGIELAESPLEARRHLGLVLEGDLGIYDRMTGRENLEFFGVLAGLSPVEARRRAGVQLEAFGLAERDKLVFGYSAGMRMRLSIARALMGEPALLLLDEPTRSLDPVAAQQVCNMLRDLAGQGRAVLVSNHRLDEVVATSDRILAVVGGQVRFEGTPEQLDPDRPSTGAAAAIVRLLEAEEASP